MQKTKTCSSIKLLCSIALYFIFAYCVISNASAKNVFSLNWEKSGSYFKNTLLVKELESGLTTTTLALPNSYKYHGDLYYLEGSKYLVYYHRSTKTQGHLTIIDAIEHKINHKLNIDPLNFAFDEIKRTTHWFLTYNQDLTEFLIFVGKGKMQKLLAIDLSSGKIIKEYELGRGATKVLHSFNRQFFWVEKINLRNKPIRVFDSVKHIELKNIAVDSRQLNTQSIGNLLFIQHKVKLKKNNTTETHQIVVFDLPNNKVIHNFNSSYPALVFNTKSSEGIYLLGRSFGKTKNLMFHQINLNYEVKDWSQPELDFKPLWAQLKTIDHESYLYATGDHQVMRMNLNDKSSYQNIPIPDKSDNAITNNDGSLLYYTQAIGSNVGMVDFPNSQLINVEKTGRSDVKFGQFVGTFLSAALTAPSGVTIYPTNGLQFSQNFLMLSNNEKWLFALNAKTSDVTIFNAKDLSEKHIIATGKKTFQMIQGTESSDMPIALLSSEKVSFISPSSGKLIGQIEYEQMLEISGNSLIVKTNNTTNVISLTHPQFTD